MQLPAQHGWCTLQNPEPEFVLAVFAHGPSNVRGCVAASVHLRVPSSGPMGGATSAAGRTESSTDAECTSRLMMNRELGNGRMEGALGGSKKNSKYPFRNIHYIYSYLFLYSITRPPKSEFVEPNRWIVFAVAHLR